MYRVLKWMCVLWVAALSCQMMLFRQLNVLLHKTYNLVTSWLPFLVGCISWCNIVRVLAACVPQRNTLFCGFSLPVLPFRSIISSSSPVSSGIRSKRKSLRCIVLRTPYVKSYILFQDLNCVPRSEEKMQCQKYSQQEGTWRRLLAYVVLLGVCRRLKDDWKVEYYWLKNISRWFGNSALFRDSGC